MVAESLATTRVRVLVVDDTPAIRKRYEAELGQMPWFEVCGEAVAAEEAIEKIQDLRPDLVLLDLGLQEGSGIDVLRAFPPGSAGPKFLVVTNHSEGALRAQCLELGAMRFFDKSSGFLDLLDLLESFGRERQN